jgi:acetyltransferase-like isoleucine patch superfamily enzyme/acyl carrier protein
VTAGPGRWLRGCDEVGEGAVLQGRPYVENKGKLTIGARLTLTSVPVQSHLVVAPGGVLEIGDDVVIGHGAAVAAHALVRIGPGSRLGPFVSIADTDFHVAGQRDAKPESSPIVLGREVRLGSRVTVLRGSVIGDGARVLAGSVVSGEVPAGATVGGVPARPVGKGAPAGAAEAGDDAATLVPRVVADTLALKEAPALELGPAELPGWDSLGSLRLLMALEERFGVTLDEAAVPKARRVADLVRLVEEAQARRQ